MKIHRTLRLFGSLVALILPKVGQADLTEVLNGSFVQELEKAGFLPEMRRKMMR